MAGTKADSGGDTCPGREAQQQFMAACGLGPLWIHSQVPSGRDGQDAQKDHKPHSWDPPFDLALVLSSVFQNKCCEMLISILYKRRVYLMISWEAALGWTDFFIMGTCDTVNFQENSKDCNVFQRSISLDQQFWETIVIFYAYII